MTKRRYPRYQHRHNAILLAALGNPSQTQKEIAKATGYSESQVSRVLCSPDFQDMYHLLLREAVVDARAKWLNRTSIRR